MSLFEASYGRKCNMPISWDNRVGISVIGKVLLEELEENMVNIGKYLKASEEM
jgi:hypothetical protein